MIPTEADLFEQIKTYLPPYLTPAEKSELYSELRKFPNNTNYYLSGHEETYLQGDGWKGFVVINFHTLAKKDVSGVILSNSCDIAPENASRRQRSILFSPLIRLAAYTGRLDQSGKSSADIENIVSTIKRQEVTSIFYLPEIRGILDESIVLLDNLHAHPLADFESVQDKERLFVLSQFGFYLFLIKLSIHFTRFQEAVKRVTT